MFIILITCVLLSSLFAPLGCSLVWQRKAYFSDGLAHACLLATSISGCFEVPIIITAPAVAVVFALLVFVTKGALASNAAINFVSSTMLALGLLLVSIFPSGININALLFGDILSVTTDDVITLSCLALMVSIICFCKIEDIILFSLNADLAAARGVSIKKIEICFLILLALVIAASMKTIGVLLVTALLMIPSYTALLLSKNPIEMIFYSFIVSVISCICGITLSFYYDFATTPSIILSCSFVYFLFLLYKKIQLFIA